MAYTVLITGASRGIGLEFTQQYLAEGYEVIATCRQPEQAALLQTLAQRNTRLAVYPVDITMPAQIAQLAQQLSTTAIDILINNAGIYGELQVNFGQIAVENLLQVFNTNAVSPLKLSEALYPQILKSRLKKIIYISSKMGSVADNTSGKSYAYRVSKAAANMLFKNMAVDLAADGTRVLILHPGWVKTQMGGPDAWIDAKTSVAGMRKLIEDNSLINGGFYAYDGQLIPW